MNKFRKRIVSVLLVTVFAMGIIFAGYPQIGHTQAEKKESFDMILRNGTIIDGTGADRYIADVGVVDGYITKIGNLSRASANTEIDVAGKVVAPGFIDIHSHGETDVMHAAKSTLTQGVTTEILSPDGGGPVDLAYMKKVEEKGLAINIGSYIGFNSVWEEVVGFDDRRATEGEIADMQALVEKALEDGAWGVSAGLFYTPGNYAKTEEVIDVVRAAAKWRTNFPNHIRNENNHVLEATAETIEIGEKAGLVPVITHMKVMGPNNWGKSEETVRLIEEANERGTFAAADQYPYLASQTGLTAIVPPWVQDGGRAEMLKRFADPALRAQIEKEIHEIIASRVQDANDVYFPTKQKTLQDIAVEKNVTPGEATMQILEGEGNLRTIYFFGDQGDFERILMHPNTAIASDGGATESNSTHPRRYGTQPRVLGKLVREDGLLSLEEAVKKMTGLPANIIGMVDRGFIKEGMVADITVFDPETVIDKATFDAPKQFAEGIEFVLLNGEFAIYNGELTGRQAGKVLLRGSDMPSRPMGTSGTERISVRGKLFDGTGKAREATEIKIFIEQEDGKLKGNFVLVDKNHKLTIKMDKPGLLQAYDGWASFTGTATVNGQGKTMPVLVTLDTESPFTGEPAIHVKVGEDYQYNGKLSGKIEME